MLRRWSSVFLNSHQQQKSVHFRFRETISWSPPFPFYHTFQLFTVTPSNRLSEKFSWWLSSNSLTETKTTGTTEQWQREKQKTFPTHRFSRISFTWFQRSHHKRPSPVTLCFARDHKFSDNCDATACSNSQVFISDAVCVTNLILTWDLRAVTVVWVYVASDYYRRLCLSSHFKNSCDVVFLTLKLIQY